MASTFVNDLRLTELGTGDASGTWGNVTNVSLELIGEALGFGTEAITTNADTHASTVADGATDQARAMFIKYTGTLDSACTITIGPNTISRLHFIENATSGSQNIIISQGSGANVTIPPGDTKVVYLDGAGSGAAVVDAFASLNLTGLVIQDDLTVKDDILLNSDSSAIKFGAGADATLTHTNDTGLTLNSTNKLMFNDASQFIQGSSATVLSLGATDEIDLTATEVELNVTTFDVNGAMTISGDTTLEDGADFITASAGTSNVRIGVNAGNSIASGGASNVTVGDESGTAITTGDHNVAVGFESLKTEDAHGHNTAVGSQALKTLNAGADGKNTAVGAFAGKLMTTGVQNTLMGGLTGDALTDADSNTAVGYQALSTDTLGSRSVAIGHSALGTQNFTSATNSNNTAVGFFAGEDLTTGVSNTLIGSQAGEKITTATNSTAVGFDALSSNTTGVSNTAVGSLSLDANTTADNSTAVGLSALGASTTGSNNTAVGSLCLDANTTGANNSALGLHALGQNTEGGANSAVGVESLNAVTTGGSNAGLGYRSGYSITTGARNSAVGEQSGRGITTGNDNIAMGHQSFFATSTASGNIGLGYRSFFSCTGGHSNVGVGYQSLGDLTTADETVAIGYRALPHVTVSNSNIGIGKQAGDGNGHGGAALTNGTGNILIGRQTDVAASGNDFSIVIGINAVGKGSNTAFINPNGGAVFAGNNNANFSTDSDRRIKKNIVDNTVGLDAINQVQVKNFEYRTADEITELPSHAAINKQGVQLGVIAQEIQSVLPNTVEEQSTGVLSVNPSNLTWHLVNAVQELSAQVTALTTRLTELEGE